MAQEKEVREVSLPIRYVIGAGSSTVRPVRGFAVVYENEDGSAGVTQCENECYEFSKVRFVDEKESRIIWTVTREKKRTSWIPAKFELVETWDLKEILLSRKN